MSKTPPLNEELRAKIALQVQGRPLPTIGGTATSALSMQLAVKKNPVTVFRQGQTRDVRVTPSGSRPDSRDLHKRAVRKFMRPTAGAERKDRLEAALLFVLGKMDPTDTKAESLLAATLIAELQALLSGRTSRLFQPIGKHDDAKITDRLWSAYMMVAVCAEAQWRLQPEGKRNREKAFLQVVEDIERTLPHGVQIDDLLPSGTPGQIRPSGPRAEEKSARALRRQRLANRFADRRREIINDQAPGIPKTLFEAGCAKLEGNVAAAYQGCLDTSAALLLMAADGESMLIKEQLPTAD